MIILHPPDTRSLLLLAAPHWWQNCTEETKTAWPGKVWHVMTAAIIKLNQIQRLITLTQKKHRKTHVHRWHVEKKGGEIVLVFVQLGCSVYTTTNWIVLQSLEDKLRFTRVGNEVTGTVQRKWESFPAMHSYVLHIALLKQALLLIRCRSVSTSLFVSYRLSTMPSVVSHDIFPWSPVSTYKSQQCCQNSRTASAESISKVSSWAIASFRALQYPVILCCLWPFSAT